MEENTENKINIENGIVEEAIIQQIAEHQLTDNPAQSYNKNLTRLLILSGLGFISIVLLGICFFLIGIKL